MKTIAVALLLSVFLGVALVTTSCAPEKRADSVVDLDIPRLGADASAPIAIGPSTNADPSRPSNVSGSVLGRWEGTGFQSDGLSWPIVVDIRSFTGVCATADYPSIPCRAEWLCTGGDPQSVSPRGKPLEAVERLLGDSATRCIDNGTMEIRLVAEDTIMWIWTGQGVSAAAQLHRVP